MILSKTIGHCLEALLIMVKQQKMQLLGKQRKKHPLIFNVDDEFNLEFKKRMGEVIASLLDRGTPFVQADADSKCCSYCRFSDFCRR